MKILFLHGWHSVVGGTKPTFLRQAGHDVANPALDDEDFDAALHAARAELSRQRPDVIVGSSRGGAIAMNLQAATVPLVLLCPAWKRWGSATKVNSQTVVLHSRSDTVIPFQDSVDLTATNGLPAEALIEVGEDHRLADPTSLNTMLQACERFKVSSENETSG